MAVAGFGLTIDPDPTLLKIAGPLALTTGVTNIANSDAGIPNSWNNMVNAWNDKPSEAPTSGLSMAANYLLPRFLVIWILPISALIVVGATLTFSWGCIVW